MSKSLENLYTLTDLSERGYTPMELRYVLLSGNYRQTLNFTFHSLDAARKALSRLGYWQKRFGEMPNELTVGACDFGPFLPVYEALLSDLNFGALGRLHSIGRRIIANIESGGLSVLESRSASRGLALFYISLELFCRLLPNRKKIQKIKFRPGYDCWAKRLEARQKVIGPLQTNFVLKSAKPDGLSLDSEDTYTLERRDLQ